MVDTRESNDQQLPASFTPLDNVGASLRRAYDEAATEPLPQAFEDLLRQLS